MELSRRSAGLGKGEGAFVVRFFLAAWNRAGIPKKRGAQRENYFSRLETPGQSLSELEGAVLALGLVAEVLNLMAEGVSQRDEESIMWLTAEIVRHPHLEVRSAAQKKERNIVLAVGVPLAQFVCPHDGGMIKHRAICAGLGQTVQLGSKVGNLSGEPLVDSQKLFLRGLIFVGLVGKAVVPLVDVKPSHACLPD